MTTQDTANDILVHMEQFSNNGRKNQNHIVILFDQSQ